jgi:hypothetical protein
MTGPLAPGKHHGGRGNVIDLAGQSFGRLDVERKLSADEARAFGCRATSAHWLCRCRCGAEKPVVGRSLLIGKTRSCGSTPCRRRS